MSGLRIALMTRRTGKTPAGFSENSRFLELPSRVQPPSAVRGASLQAQVLRNWHPLLKVPLQFTLPHERNGICPAARADEVKADVNKRKTKDCNHGVGCNGMERLVKVEERCG